MQQSDFDELPASILEKLYQSDIVKKQDEVATAAVLKSKIDELNTEGKLLSLAEDEYRLLMDYRAWRLTNAAATGVFHWRKST